MDWTAKYHSVMFTIFSLMIKNEIAQGGNECPLDKWFACMSFVIVYHIGSMQIMTSPYSNTGCVYV
jgi:hypothetical protein